MDRVLRPVQTLTNFSKCQGYNDADASARRMKIRCISYLEMCENHLWSKDIMYKLELHWNIYALNINVWQTVFDTVGKLPVKTVETNIINFRMFIFKWLPATKIIRLQLESGNEKTLLSFHHGVLGIVLFQQSIDIVSFYFPSLGWKSSRLVKRVLVLCL